MFMFKYRPFNTDKWSVPGGRKPFKTIGFARRAAKQWEEAMDAEGCPVVTEVYQLVSDGRGGLMEGSAV